MHLEISGFIGELYKRAKKFWAAKARAGFGLVQMNGLCCRLSSTLCFLFNLAVIKFAALSKQGRRGLDDVLCSF